MKLVVGLGNPGKKYEKTRHNIGFMAIDALHAQLEEHNVSEWSLSKKFNAEVSGCTINNEKIILAKPMTFMNDSGHAVALIVQFYKMHPSEIIILHDDKDLPLGAIRSHEDRGHAGHNGVKSIIECMGTQDFRRIRIGIANEKKQAKKDTAEFVLGKFSILERSLLKKCISEAADTALKLIF
jgi:PTH1 family peptidyl-tRNA hydrolase